MTHRSKAMATVVIQYLEHRDSTTIEFYLLPCFNAAAHANFRNKKIIKIVVLETHLFSR